MAVSRLEDKSVDQSGCLANPINHADVTWGYFVFQSPANDAAIANSKQVFFGG